MPDEAYLRWHDVPELPKLREVADFPNHHHVVVRCVICDWVWEALYPSKGNPELLQCSKCGAQDSQIVKYLRYVYLQ